MFVSASQSSVTKHFRLVGYMLGTIHTTIPQQTPPIFQSYVSLPSAAAISTSEEAPARRDQRRCWRCRLRSKCQLSWPGIYQVPADSKSYLLGCTWRLRKSQGQRRGRGSPIWGTGWNSRFCSVCWVRRFANIATILRASSWRSKRYNILLVYLPTILSQLFVWFVSAENWQLRPLTLPKLMASGMFTSHWWTPFPYCIPTAPITQ